MDTCCLLISSCVCFIHLLGLHVRHCGITLKLSVVHSNTSCQHQLCLCVCGCVRMTSWRYWLLFMQTPGFVSLKCKSLIRFLQVCNIHLPWHYFGVTYFYFEWIVLVCMWLSAAWCACLYLVVCFAVSQTIHVSFHVYQFVSYLHVCWVVCTRGDVVTRL